MGVRKHVPELEMDVLHCYRDLNKGVSWCPMVKAPDQGVEVFEDCEFRDQERLSFWFQWFHGREEVRGRRRRFLSKRWLSSAVVGFSSEGRRGVWWICFSTNVDEFIIC